MGKELEALKNIKREAGVPYFSTLYDIDMWREDFATVETALKALEIIKEIDKNALLQFISVCVKDQAEYDLLKEVLCSKN